MSNCRQYGGITRDELASLKRDLAQQGVKVPEGDDVTFSGPFGIELQAAYDETAKTLQICILNKPFFVPESEIWKIVDTGTAPYAKS